MIPARYHNKKSKFKLMQWFLHKVTALGSGILKITSPQPPASHGMLILGMPRTQGFTLHKGTEVKAIGSAAPHFGNILH
jgi:hypothetical protein